ncbi:Hypothetical predicted protein [Olea europaea subsp. europaea]|uniref:Uncharacterized protein n=1 Tax=Olea europaea subsp. europaea TaxID=158383 RepID=A0A8S0TMR4_OLEEU|nr:Hypothetical predicted protein [Olea europaea subsp. europaea]
MRVKFPKLLMKSMQRRNHNKCTDESNVDQENSWKNGDFLRKRIGFIILNACGSKKAQEMSSSSNQPMETDNADDSNLKNVQDSMAKQETIFDEIQEAKESAGLEEKVLYKKPDKMPTKISRFIRKRIGSPFRKLKLDEKSNGGASEKNSSQKVDERKRIMKKLIIRDGEEEKEERSEMELCKKRILMGEKCRPLNLSGALHYDKDGILLPEEIL